MGLVFKLMQLVLKPAMLGFDLWLHLVLHKPDELALLFCSIKSP